MRKAAGCVLLAILCLLGASYLPRILQEAQTDREQQNLISGYIQNPDTTDEENTESTTDESYVCWFRTSLRSIISPVVASNMMSCIG